MDREGSDRPMLNQRKSSLSDTLSKMASSTFSRRRTTSNMPAEDPSATLTTDATIKRPPSRIPRRNSIFGSLTSISSVPNKENNEPQSAPPKKSRRISDRLAQSALFNTQANPYSIAPALAPQQTRRESKTYIAERKLMAPIVPPLPRSSTMPIQQLSSPSVPSFMRPTSSSTARRSDVALVRNIGTVIGNGPRIPTPPKNRKSRASIGHPGGAQRRASSNRLLTTSIAAEPEPAPSMTTLREPSLTASRPTFNDAPTSNSSQAGEPTRIPTPVVEEEIESDDEHAMIPTPNSGASNPRLVRWFASSVSFCDLPRLIAPLDSYSSARWLLGWPVGWLFLLSALSLTTI